MTRIVFSTDEPPVAWSDLGRFSSQYGAKASSILAVPRLWTPDFALVSHEDLREADRLTPLTSLLNEATLERLRLLGDPTSQIIIRSSVIGESIWDRGKYESIRVECTGPAFFENLDKAARRVMESAQLRETGLLVQRYHEPVQRGEFGNLLRISKTRDHWEISTEEGDGTTTRQRINTQRDRAAPPTQHLEVRRGLSRERLFASIGAWLNNELLLGKRQRLNCEWVTDNFRFYLVQVDYEDEDFLGVNPFQLPVLPTPDVNAAKGTYLRHAAGELVKAWDKLQVLEELWEPGASHKPTLFCVPLIDLPEPSDSEGLLALERDFRKLMGLEGIIVRTSVATDDEKRVNLPRTEGLSPAEAARWCLSTSQKLQQNSTDLELAFVAHRFVASRASAWVRAEPGSPLVEIHALWGLPDALQFCPYDIWEVHLPTGTATDYPEYKSDMLLSKSDGSWEYARVKNELARYNSITSAEAKDLAKRSSAIADKLSHSCHIMWFIGCIDADGTAFNIPWYWTPLHDAEHNPDRTAFRTIEVSDRESLRHFQGWTGSRRRQALLLKPRELALMRDNAFIEEVGISAHEANVPVILAGSTLAHAYYLLRTKGCTVVTPSKKEHVRIRRKVRLGKLVRDKVPAKIKGRQEHNITKEIPASLRGGFILGKLIEEAMEVRGAREHQHKLEELADLFEVLRALAGVEAISLEQVEREAERKRHKVGGFDKGLVLIQTGITGTGRDPRYDVEHGVGDLVIEHASEDTVEIPFTFFGFMEFDQSRVLRLSKFGLWLEISLRTDRIEIKLVREPDQLTLSLD